MQCLCSYTLITVLYTNNTDGIARVGHQFTGNVSCDRNFWELVAHMSRDLQKRLLLFTTGSDRIPIGGMSEMQFKITRVDNTDMWVMFKGSCMWLSALCGEYICIRG